MNKLDYFEQFGNLLHEIKRLREERDEINLNIIRLIRLIECTASMVPGSGVEFSRKADKIVERLLDESVDLREAVRIILRSSPHQAFTPPMIRGELDGNGFSFAAYRSNPLVSINSILKKLHTDGVITISPDGKKSAYKWKLFDSGALLGLLEKKKEAE